MKKAIYAIYLGGGYLPGIPARDLTKEEYEQHKATIEACPTLLYEVRKKVNESAAQTGESNDG